MADPASASRPSAPADDGGTSPFLRGVAPRWAAGGLAWVVILLLVGAAVAAIAIRVPETVSSEFLLVPARGVDPVRVPRAGRVTDVGVGEGTTVAKGQMLFVIRSGAVGDQSAEMAALETQLRGAEAARANEREKHDGQRRADDEQRRGFAERGTRLAARMETHRALRQNRETRHQTSLRMAESELESVRAEIEFKREHLGLAREIATRHRWGYEANFLSWQEYMRANIEASRTAVELEQLQRALDIAQLKLVQLRAERDVEETEWRVAMAQLESEADEIRVATEKLRHETAARAAEHRELDRRHLEDVAKATIRVAAVRGALTEARGDRLTVSAPCAGTVVRLAVKRQDANVHEGEVLCEVSCTGERLQAELTVPPSGIGKIKLGQGVKLRYAAFPYERYGVRYATVQWVSAVGAGESRPAGFRALAGLEEEAVRIDGQLRPLLAGMGGRADIVVGRRSLVSYAFEPLRRLREDLSAGPRR
jgi:HlyD family secretion protein